MAAVNYWQNVAKNNPAYFGYLEGSGFTEDDFNALSPEEMGAVYFEFKGIDPADSNPNRHILGELPGAVVDTVKEQGGAIAKGVKGVYSGARNLLILAALLAGAVALVVYKPFISKFFKKAAA